MNNEELIKKIELIAAKIGYKLNIGEHNQLDLVKPGGFKILIRSNYQQKYTLTALLPSVRHYSKTYKSGNFGLRTASVERLVADIKRRILCGYDEAYEASKQEALAYKNLKTEQAENYKVISHLSKKYFNFNFYSNSSVRNAYVNLYSDKVKKIEFDYLATSTINNGYTMTLKDIEPGTMLKILALLREEVNSEESQRAKQA